MNILELSLSGCYLIESVQFKDDRGTFVKTFHSEVFKEKGLEPHFAEEFYSISNKNVIRGMHFQTPPVAHDKFVFCAQGAVLDVFLDLRMRSATFGQVCSVELSQQNVRSLYLPKGIAHGFRSLSDNSLMIYKTSTVYTPSNDAGIKWNTIEFDWLVDQPIVSERDNSFISFKDFKSPF